MAPRRFPPLLETYANALPFERDAQLRRLYVIEEFVSERGDAPLADVDVAYIHQWLRQRIMAVGSHRAVTEIFYLCHFFDFLAHRGEIAVSPLGAPPFSYRRCGYWVHHMEATVGTDDGASPPSLSPIFERPFRSAWGPVMHAFLRYRANLGYGSAETQRSKLRVLDELLLEIAPHGPPALEAAGVRRLAADVRQLELPTDDN